MIRGSSDYTHASTVPSTISAWKRKFTLETGFSKTNLLMTLENSEENRNNWCSKIGSFSIKGPKQKKVNRQFDRKLKKNGTSKSET